ncbi:inositol 5-phosphatase [Xylariaceae sp. FL0016]|nr:inositol 5-phosphatase [Xylariaceae sp. FL0016]
MGEPIPIIDVFILTFNAAKSLINVPIFSKHLYDCFGQRSQKALPELVVVCLQEMAPLAKAFIGSYMLSPYFQSYESAINAAAARFISDEERRLQASPDPPYTLIKTGNVGMTGIMLFALHPENIHNLQAAEVGFGAGDMANKGAVGIRLLYTKENYKAQVKETELTFVSTHLAHTEWNLEKRNKNWETIVSGLLFEDPKKLIRPSAEPTPRHSQDGQESQPLMDRTLDEQEKAMQKISVYKPGSHLFVAGDLNYRISKTAPDSTSKFPVCEPESPYHWRAFLQRDQLRIEQDAKRTMQGLVEAAINFPPTYKVVCKPTVHSGSTLEDIAVEQDNANDPKWTWAPHRWPSWCDRVLFTNIPWWAQAPADEHKEMKITVYDAIPPLQTSDHRPVYLRLEVPVMPPSKLSPSDLAYETELALERSEPPDPRVKLPYPIDIQSWEHRAYVKKWESIIGWSMVISKSKQGIAVFVTILVLGMGTWWLRSS